jgi:hypothetical protein
MASRCACACDKCLIMHGAWSSNRHCSTKPGAIRCQDFLPRLSIQATRRSRTFRLDIRTTVEEGSDIVIAETQCRSSSRPVSSKLHVHLDVLALTPCQQSRVRLSPLRWSLPTPSTMSSPRSRTRRESPRTNSV